jgi:hypothetical protein
MKFKNINELKNTKLKMNKLVRHSKKTSLEIAKKKVNNMRILLAKKISSLEVISQKRVLTSKEVQARIKLINEFNEWSKIQKVLIKSHWSLEKLKEFKLI